MLTAGIDDGNCSIRLSKNERTVLEGVTQSDVEEFHLLKNIVTPNHDS